MSKKIDRNILEIKKFINAAGTQIYDINALGALLEELKIRDWVGARGTTEELIERMAPFNLFKKEAIHRSNNGRPLHYYLTGDTSDLKFISHLSTKCFFSHATALTWHGIESLPGSIFQTIGQLENSKPMQPLSQQAIDNAFRKPQRKPSNYYSWKNYAIYQLHRKVNDQIGIVEDKKNKGVYFTDMEQTLLDISVRPLYAGGVQDVIAAYQNLQNKLDTDKLLLYLQNGNYAYPYQQAIGFYLDYAGYPERQWAAFESMKSSYNFYLDYAMQHPVFDDKWKIFIPAALHR